VWHRLPVSQLMKPIPVQPVSHPDPHVSHPAQPVTHPVQPVSPSVSAVSEPVTQSDTNGNEFR